MKKIFTLFAAVMVSALSFATITEYTLTITPTDFTTVSYGDNNGEHTWKAVAADKSTIDIVCVTNQVYQNSSLIQGQANTGYIYNKTHMGSIKSITINDKVNYTSIIGKEEHPTEEVAAGAYFTIKAGSKASKSSGIVIVFEKSDEVVAVTGVELDKSALSLEVGEKATLTATVKPLDATNKEYAWSTTDDKVATIVDGVVTATGVGAATITATTKDGSKTATCAVTVVAATKSDYVPTDLTEIKTGDEVIIVMKNDTTGLMYALNPNSANSSSPKAYAVREFEGTLKDYIEGGVFSVSYDKEQEGYVFSFTPGEDTQYALYTNASSNDGVRVNKISDNNTNYAWVIAENHLRTAQQFHTEKTDKADAKDFYRYLGVYVAGMDYRTYESIGTNIKSQSVLFYVKSNGATAVENSEVEMKAAKIVRNGQVIIVREGVEYNVMGARL